MRLGHSRLATSLECTSTKVLAAFVALWLCGIAILLGTDIAGASTRHAIFGAVGVLVFACAMVRLYAERQGRREVRSHGNRLCPECSFDLRDLPDSGRCPECGASYSGVTLREQWRDAYPDL